MLATAPSFNKCQLITKSDTANFELYPTLGLCDAIFVGGAGIVEVVFQNDETCDFTCAASTYLWVRAKRVNSSTTSATVMVALWAV